jgi:hypothetical protein
MIGIGAFYWAHGGERLRRPVREMKEVFEMNGMIDIGARRELFVDQFLVDSLEGVAFKLHTPQLTPAAAGGSPCGHYMSVLKDADRYRAYYRQIDPQFAGVLRDGHPGEITCLAESDDGSNWRFPELGLFEVNGTRSNNAVLRVAPYSHNFSPFVDARPDAEPIARYKALAGTHKRDGHGVGDNLHAFGSADGIHWKPLQNGPVIEHAGFAFDSQNVSFWSAAESCYVCYFRSWETPHGRLRTISRTTSPDFLHWTEPVPMAANLPGEHLYTSQTHPYFRAPHIYVALPTRFCPDRGDSTDILFMATRAGSTRYERLFTEAFIAPGLDPKRWGNRSNYAACGVVPTGPAEMSIYHGPAGRRYTLRTDGFVSLRAGFTGGTMTTKPFTFDGAELSLNVATSAAGSARVELRDETGRPLPGRSLAEADVIVGDTIHQRVTWRGDGDVSALAGRPVRLHIVLREADLYSLAFGPSFFGPAAPAMRDYFKVLADASVGNPNAGSTSSNLEAVYSGDLVSTLELVLEAARDAVRDQPDCARRLAPILDGFDVARQARDIIENYPGWGDEELARRLKAAEAAVVRFNPDDVFGLGPALYPPIPRRWQDFSSLMVRQARALRERFGEFAVAQSLDKAWRFLTDPDDQGLGAGWMQPAFDDGAWAVIHAVDWWQNQGYPAYHGTAWYRRKFVPPTVASGRRLILYFGAVDGDATVFIDGRQVCEHLLRSDMSGWDEPFQVDVTDLLSPDRPHCLAVRVRKTICLAGIYRGVKLLEVSGCEMTGA